MIKNKGALIINTLKLFWPIMGQRKTSLVIFLCKRRTSSVVFLAIILFLVAYIGHQSVKYQHESNE